MEDIGHGNEVDVFFGSPRQAFWSYPVGVRGPLALGMPGQTRLLSPRHHESCRQAFICGSCNQESGAQFPHSWFSHPLYAHIRGTGCVLQKAARQQNFQAFGMAPAYISQPEGGKSLYLAVPRLTALKLSDF